MSKPDRSRVIRFAEAQVRIPGPAGERAVVVLQRGPLDVALSLPLRPTPQTPHAQDEIYFPTTPIPSMAYATVSLTRWGVVSSEPSTLFNPQTVFLLLAISFRFTLFRILWPSPKTISRIFNHFGTLAAKHRVGYTVVRLAYRRRPPVQESPSQQELICLEAVL